MDAISRTFTMDLKKNRNAGIGMLALGSLAACDSGVDQTTLDKIVQAERANQPDMTEMLADRGVSDTCHDVAEQALAILRANGLVSGADKTDYEGSSARAALHDVGLTATEIGAVTAHTGAIRGQFTDMITALATENPDCLNADELALYNPAVQRDSTGPELEGIDLARFVR